MDLLVGIQRGECVLADGLNKYDMRVLSGEDAVCITQTCMTACLFSFAFASR